MPWCLGFFKLMINVAILKKETILLRYKKNFVSLCGKKLTCIFFSNVKATYWMNFPSYPASGIHRVAPLECKLCLLYMKAFFISYFISDKNN